MSANSSGDQVAQIEDKIRSLADAYLASGRPYLLSKLGKDLGNDLRILKNLTDVPLAQFLTDRFGTEYSVVLSGSHNNVQALVRCTDTKVTFDSVRKDDQSSNSNLRNDVPRYNYRFWTAFSVPLGQGRRFLSLRDFTFQDLEQKPLGDYEEVEPEFITREDVSDRDAIIRENIKKWLTAKGFLAEQFAAKPRQISERASRIPGGRSILETVINALDRRQLVNTTMSLDVVASLLRKRV